MNIIKVKDKFEGGKTAFNLLKNEMTINQLNTLGLATGSTPETLYQEIVKSDLDFTKMNSVNLDEYVGITANNPQSYHYYMKKHLFDKKPFKANYIPNGMAKNAEKECKRYDKIIEDHPIDIQFLGIGENAHIGFNEPGASFEGMTGEVELTKSTIRANSRNFTNKEDVPTHAYSMGIKSIMMANKIILMAYGEKKAQAVFDTIRGPITEEVPASVLQRHPNVIMIIDEEAASLI